MSVRPRTFLRWANMCKYIWGNTAIKNIINNAHKKTQIDTYMECTRT